jgi:hypothetical protein
MENFRNILELIKYDNLGLKNEQRWSDIIMEKIFVSLSNKKISQKIIKIADEMLNIN